MDCKPWTGTVSNLGYGIVWVSRGVQYLAHRVAYCKAHGIELESIKGKVIRHTCDNPICVNPDHLIIGTQLDNIRDRVERGRSCKGSKHTNSKLTDEDVAYIRANYVKGCKSFGGAVLARKYKVHKACIYRVVASKTY